MANLRNFRGTWYARSRWSENGRKVEKLTPLKTKSKVTARERIAEVNKVEDDIIEIVLLLSQKKSPHSWGFLFVG